MMSKLEEMDKKFDAWEDEDMNQAETKYYLKVHSRILEKLADLAY